ncbi:uncharacterized protein F5Z01DRAFT_174290 [Emericellopsis atlantica]|uniref:Rhodopsin domain-containing protein n=1 Tax=Emericellopsis atlantica TaxID=2614577 RepID=A0A9P7ZJY5_9HYPO|nr:uncharacterized protein F5Z01DRAFT_174290 [Emericellopsis atlantica]KAG9253101.1 hypothetical protein F5Z01DRAFT_174290 [Emericellopsis atlantica]
MSAADLAALFPPDQYPYHWNEVPIVGKSLAFLIANYVLEPVVIAVVALRFYSRTTMGTLGWDDWFVLIAKILCICTLTVVTCLSAIGSGYYVEQVAMNLSTVYLLIFILQGFFLFANMTVKLSVCFFYLRVFVGNGMRVATYITMGLVVAWAVAHFIAAIFICNPVQGQWDLRFTPTAQCGDQMKFFQSGLSINVVLDFIILVLPWYTIWNLNMRMSDKLGLTLAFSIGIGMTVVGIIRAIYDTTTSMKGDITATLPTNLFLTVIEQQLAIITVSIPMLRPLWCRYRARLGGYSLEESEQVNKGSLPNGTFGGSGAKRRSLPRRKDDNDILESHFELGSVSGEEGHLDAVDSGSETRLDGKRRGRAT